MLARRMNLTESFPSAVVELLPERRGAGVVLLLET